jgi:hypothetical protein
MTIAYNFQQQLSEGQKGERFLDEFFRPDYAITPATPQEQRQGIDRIFTHRRTRRRLKVEYKTDSWSGRTGNAFVETVSVDTAGKAGWALTSQADFLVYYVPDPATIYIVKMAALRRQLAAWQTKYVSRTVQNDNYQTTGLLVPLDEFERLATEVY